MVVFIFLFFVVFVFVFFCFLLLISSSVCREKKGKEKRKKQDISLSLFFFVCISVRLIATPRKYHVLLSNHFPLRGFFFLCAVLHVTKWTVWCRCENRSDAKLRQSPTMNFKHDLSKSRTEIVLISDPRHVHTHTRTRKKKKEKKKTEEKKNRPLLVRQKRSL